MQYILILKGDSLDIVWMLEDPAPNSLLELVCCKTCKKCDTCRCSCKENRMKCTDICGCSQANCEDTGRYIPGEDDEEEDQIEENED